MRAINRKKLKNYSSQAKNRQSNRGVGQGRLTILGLGPGDISLLTQRAKDALDASNVIIGYKTYVKLLGNLTVGKEVVSSGMTKEAERAKKAIQMASAGERVALVSGGDAGIYGMAGMVLELLGKEAKKIKLEIIPGISAASSCASLLGAPLANDFVTISLSDLLTDKRLIQKRIEAACLGDFVVVFYNPCSLKRVVPLQNAWRILMRYKSPDTVVGIARNAYRDNQQVEIVKLKDMLFSKIIDMFTTIIVGNSKTYVKDKYMITPRGYGLKTKLSCPAKSGIPMRMKNPPFVPLFQRGKEGDLKRIFR